MPHDVRDARRLFNNQGDVAPLLGNNKPGLLRGKGRPWRGGPMPPSSGAQKKGYRSMPLRIITPLASAALLAIGISAAPARAQPAPDLVGGLIFGVAAGAVIGSILSKNSDGAAVEPARVKPTVIHHKHRRTYRRLGHGKAYHPHWSKRRWHHRGNSRGSPSPRWRNERLHHEPRRHESRNHRPSIKHERHRRDDRSFSGRDRDDRSRSGRD